ncbi:MAG: class I SAM-dependent methyltransferase [Hyphomicrobium sp.]
MTVDSKAAFLEDLRASIAQQVFVRLSLGKSRNVGAARKCVVTQVTAKTEMRLRFVETRGAQDVTSIKALAAGVAEIDRVLGVEFLSATLFTTVEDVTLTYNKRLEAQSTRSKPTQTSPARTDHNRAKSYIVDANRGYLKQLGVSMDDGRVKPSMYAKFKQICHFIEIIDDVLRGSPLQATPEIAAIDIGSGKGYLTFALYDYLTAKLGKKVRMTGVDVRADLVSFCNELASRERFDGLSFDAAAASAPARPIDLLIALHACDTATDDAIASGVAANAAVIVVAPCCQHELAPQMSRSNGAMAGLMKFGLLRQRQADLVTDAARALLMEASGYKVKVIEFVSTEHTSKNLMLAAVCSNDVDRDAARRQYQELKAFAGFKTHRLESQLDRLTSVS